jgi:hypothetical protein
MNSEFKNEILMDGYLYDRDLENKKFQIKNNEDIIEFRYNEDFKENSLEELQGNELLRIKGSFDQDENGLFYLAKDMLVLPQFSKGDE